MRNTFLFCLISLTLISCEHQPRKDKSPSDSEIPFYKIGINLPLSGNGSYFAEEYKKGMDMAFDFANSGEKIRIEAIYEDNKMNPMDAVTITKKFIEIDGIDLFVCGYTPIIQATIGLAEKHGIPAMAVLSSAENIAASYQWVFRDFGMESQMMPMLAEHSFTNMGLKNGTWLVINDDMGHDAVRFFTEKFNELGGTLLQGETFEASEMDLRNKISKVMAGDPEFIIVVGRGAAMMNACRQIRERDENIPVFGTNSMDSPALWNALGTSANNFWFSGFYIDLDNQRTKRVNERFRTRFGYDLNWLNLYGLSTANYLVRGLKESNGQKEAMRDFLTTLNFESMRGQLVMNDKHDVMTTHIVYQRRGGQSFPAAVNK